MYSINWLARYKVIKIGFKNIIDKDTPNHQDKHLEQLKGLKGINSFPIISGKSLTHTWTNVTAINIISMFDTSL